MCKMFGVLSLAYVAAFTFAVVNCEEVPEKGIVDYLNTGNVCVPLSVSTSNEVSLLVINEETHKCLYLTGWNKVKKILFRYHIFVL